jgi:competence protein ComGF
LLQKTISENGRQLHNDGKSDRYLYYDNNPAIISIEMFKSTQRENNVGQNFQKMIMHMSDPCRAESFLIVCRPLLSCSKAGNCAMLFFGTV